MSTPKAPLTPSPSSSWLLLTWHLPCRDGACGELLGSLSIEEECQDELHLPVRRVCRPATEDLGDLLGGLPWRGPSRRRGTGRRIGATWAHQARLSEDRWPVRLISSASRFLDHVGCHASRSMRPRIGPNKRRVKGLSASRRARPHARPRRHSRIPFVARSSERGGRGLP